MSDSGENFEELIARFYEGPEAEQIQRDIRLGDKMLAECPDVSPPRQVVDAIKTMVAEEASSRKCRTRMIRNVAGVAAVAVIAILASILLAPKPQPGIIAIVPAPWSIDEDDISITIVSNELDELMDSMLETRLDEYNDERTSLEELEREIQSVAINEDNFWKG